MNPTAASQIALDNALVPPEARLKIGECNRRIEFSKPQREATYQATLDALKLSPCYPAFLITAGVPEIYMHPLWNTITKVKDSSSYQFKLDNKKFRVNAKVFRDILQICPKLPHRPFDIPPSTDEEINVDFVELLWEDFSFQIDNHFSKESMPYPRFTKIIINHFISQNKSISMRNKINLHTARDDSLLGTLKYVSKTEEHQVYGALIPKEMLNEDILNSTAYQTYYAYDSGAKEPVKARKFKKPASPKLKTVLVSPKEHTKKPAKKPEPAKKKAPTKGKRSKGIEILFNAALTEAAQLKEATKQIKKDFYISQASGLGDGTDLNQGGEEDDDNDDDNDNDDDDGNDDDGDNDDNDDDSDHKRTESDRDENPNLNQSNEEHEEEEEEYDDEFTDKEDDADYAKEENEEELDDTEELYKDVNVNLRKEDVEMTDADQGGADQHNVSQESRFKQEEEDAHVTLTALRKKLLNFENISLADNEIASLMDTTVRHENVSPAVNEIASLMIHMVKSLSQQALLKAHPALNISHQVSLPMQRSKVIQLMTRECDRIKSLTRVTMINPKSKVCPCRGAKSYEAASKSDWYKKPEQPPTPDLDWNKRQHVDFRPSQTWISNIARAEEPRTSFDELVDTPIDFSAFVMNRLNITNLTQELFVGPTFNILKGTCKSRTELEYHFDECFKATTE
ncbi:hypothetical protein Tco_0256602 [Tanacetum coccineum]